MKKRRLVAWGLALTMGLLAGCSGQTKTETTTAVAAKEEKAETAETTAAAAGRCDTRCHSDRRSCKL